jgi:hypothetical protein
MTVVLNATIDLRRQIRNAFRAAAPVPQPDQAAVIAAHYKLTVLAQVVEDLRARDTGLRFRLVQPAGAGRLLHVRASHGPADRQRLPYIEVSNSAGRAIGEIWLDLQVAAPEEIEYTANAGYDIAVVDVANWSAEKPEESRLLLGVEACWYPYGECSLLRSLSLRSLAAPVTESGAATAANAHLVYSQHSEIDNLADRGDRLGLYLHHLPM